MSKLFDILQLDNEEWRDIAGFEGIYRVSTFGRVKSLDRITNDGKHIKGKMLSPQGAFHQSVNLWKDRKSYNRLLHRVVAETFISNPNGLPEVNHKDNDPLNNRVDNLEWVTSSENSLHRLRTGIGSSNPKGRSVLCLETREKFNSISAAGRSVSASTQQVIDSIATHSCCKGFTFVYCDSLPDDIEAYMRSVKVKYQNFHKRPQMKNSKKVRIIETGQVFDSISAASRFLNCDPATVVARIKNNRTVNNMTLVYKEDEK